MLGIKTFILFQCQMDLLKIKKDQARRKKRGLSNARPKSDADAIVAIAGSTS